MSERKVINKYFPPNFDPSLIPRRKLKDKNNQQVVRLMAPFSMRCNSCGEYIYKGKKFNARKETVEGEDYMGIRIFRFYIKCTLCSTEITFRTDPKNADYLAEHGASRNFESWRDDEAAQAEKAYMPDAGDDDIEEMERKKEAEDAMQVVENAQAESKREMDIMDALQDLRQRNARNEKRQGIAGPLGGASSSKPVALTPEQMLKQAQEEEDELLVRQHFSRIANGAPAPASAVDLKGKGKAVASTGGLDGYGSGSDDGSNAEDEDKPEVDEAGAVAGADQVTIVKRKLGGDDESPSVEALLAKKGLAPPSSGAPSAGGGAGGFGFGAAAAKKRKVGAGVPGLVLKKKK